MKRILILGFSAVLLTGGISSCKKTSKGKLSNEWTVSKMTEEFSDVDEDGDSSSESVSITDKIGTSTSTDIISGVTTTTTKSGAVNEYSYTINKDGSFTIVEDIAWTQAFTGGSTTKSTKTTTTGTWTFLGKNKSEEFKKNEFVAFYAQTSESNTTNSTTIGGTTTSTSNSNSSKSSGNEYVKLYKVIESKKKELQLSSEYIDAGTVTNSSGTGTGKDTSKEVITLVQK